MHKVRQPNEFFQFNSTIAEAYEIRSIMADNEETSKTLDNLIYMCKPNSEAIIFALIFLKQSGISNDKIKRIIRTAFDLNMDDAVRIVNCYNGNPDNETLKYKRKDKDGRNFSSIMMAQACSDEAVLTSQENEKVLISEEILKKSNYTLPVSDILSATLCKNGTYMSSENHQISEHHINIVRTGIKKFNRVFAKFPHKEYWSLFFKYMPKLSHNGYILHYLLLFPKLDDSCIERFTHASISSPSYEDFQFQYNYLSPLRDYETELARLDITPPNDFNEEDRIKLLSTLTVREFTECLSMIGNMEVIAEFNLRPIDLKAIYILLMCYPLDILDSIFYEDTLIPLFESRQHMRQN